MKRPFRFSLASALTKAASFAPAAVNLSLTRYDALAITLQITAAERDSANETYDVYVIMGDGLSEWDIAHFPQIATTGAKTFTARVLADPNLPANVTTAAPGVAANDAAILATVAGGTNAPKSLAAGLVRHGPFGNYIRHELVVAGTVVTGISYSLAVQAS